jgi:hypothetical protein
MTIQVFTYPCLHFFGDLNLQTKSATITRKFRRKANRMSISSPVSSSNHHRLCWNLFLIAHTRTGRKESIMIRKPLQWRSHQSGTSSVGMNRINQVQFIPNLSHLTSVEPALEMQPRRSSQQTVDGSSSSHCPFIEPALEIIVLNSIDPTGRRTLSTETISTTTESDGLTSFFV